jgi:hypothetical protein
VGTGISKTPGYLRGDNEIVNTICHLLSICCVTSCLVLPFSSQIGTKQMGTVGSTLQMRKRRPKQDKLKDTDGLDS